MEVLEIVTDLRVGGAQRVAANISKYAKPNYHFTYLVFDEQIGDYESEILERGNDVIHIPSPKKGYIAYLSSLWEQLRAKPYSVVHCHNMYSCGLVMLLANHAGIPGRVSHSHTAKDNILRETLLRKAYKRAMRNLICRYSTDYLACGKDAGEELFGKELFSRKGVVIKNGIDAAAYRYNQEQRNLVRKQYCLGGRFVIGHVGHYVEVKNQMFLIQMMPDVLKKRPDAVLLLFGDGEMRMDMQAEIERLGLAESVQLMGNVSNIPQILSALDVFAFPSILEGTPLALLEAQANGLPCVISDTIPDDACLTDLIKKISLSDQSAWIEALLTVSRNTEIDYSVVLSSKYEDIRTSIERLYQIIGKYSREE